MIRPLRNVVLIELDKPTEIINGMHVPESIRSKPTKGHAKACGPTCEHVRVGDYLEVPRHSGTEIILDGRLSKLLKETECFGILSEA